MNESCLIKMKHQLKTQLILYFDAIKCDIDIQSQKFLMDDSTDEEKRKEILNLNQFLIEKAESLFEKNSIDLETYFNQNDLINCESADEYIRKNAFKQYCIFIEGESLRSELKDSNPIGILVITDFYINQGQQSFIR